MDDDSTKTGKAETLKNDNKTWHWCIHHLSWCLDTSDDCHKGKGMMQQTVSRQSTKAVMTATIQVEKVTSPFGRIMMQDE